MTGGCIHKPNLSFSNRDPQYLNYVLKKKLPANVFRKQRAFFSKSYLKNMYGTQCKSGCSANEPINGGGKSNPNTFV